MMKLRIGVNPQGRSVAAGPPKRLKSGELSFEDEPLFRPNMTPEEVLRAGSFGGGYFRDIHSSVTNTSYKDAWRELPESWIDGLNIKREVASSTYRVSVNRYGVNCGGKADKKDTFGLVAWETSGWMNAQDPYGWFQWYCRFYCGRRSDDDDRQIKRWLNCAGVKGRWRSNLVGKCLRDNKAFDDPTVSPVVRQTLQHWAYTLSENDFISGAKRVKKRGATYVPRDQLKAVIQQETEKDTKKRRRN